MFHFAVFCPVIKRRAAVLALCRAYFQLHKQPSQVRSYHTYEELLTEPFAHDAFLLPVGSPTNGQALPEGIVLAQQLRAMGVQAPIIFVGITTEWAYEAYRVNALQYLLSPLSSDTLYPALTRACATPRSPIYPCITADGLYGIPFHEIESIECTNHILHFHRPFHETVQSVTLRVSMRTALAPLLADPCFLQPHRSYIINMSAVDCLLANEFKMKSGARIPIPRERHAEMKAKYLAFLQGKLKV